VHPPRRIEDQRPGGPDAFDVGAAAGVDIDEAAAVEAQAELVEPGRQLGFAPGGDEAPLPEPKIDGQGRAYATGKRKTAVARVWIKPGSGRILVNQKDQEDYFGRPVLRMIIAQPLQAASRQNQYDVVCTVKGSGPSGQAGAIRHGIAKALTYYEPELRTVLIVETGAFALQGAIQARKVLRETSLDQGHTFDVRVVGTMFDRRTRFERELLIALHGRFGERMYDTVIRTSVRLREAPAQGVPVQVLDPTSRAANDFDALAREVLAHKAPKRARTVARAGVEELEARLVLGED